MIAAARLRRDPDVEREFQLAQGFKAWTMPPVLAVNQGAFLSSNRVEATAAFFRAGDLVTGLCQWTGGVGEAGTNLHKLAIFSLDGATRYGVTADVKALFGVNSLVQAPLVTPWLVRRSGLYLIAGLVDPGAGTKPNVYRAAGWPTVLTPAGGASNIMGLASAATGLTDMPNTVVWVSLNYAFAFGAY